MSPPLTLYGYWRSSSAWRVRIALAYKGVEHESLAVHLVREGGEQHAEAHRERNPMRQVPVLMVGDTPLSQSVAIIEYLEETYPAPTLFPGDALARARARQAAEIVNSGIQPLQNLRVLQRLRDEHGQDADGVKGWAARWIAEGLGALEALVSSTGGRHCIGDSLSVADVFLIPQLYNARRFGVDPADFPALAPREESALAHPAFSTTRPERQADAA